MGVKQGMMRWYLIMGMGSMLVALLVTAWMAEPVAACGVRCGGPHPTARPKAKPVASRPFQKPPQAAAVVPKAPPKPAPTATPRPAPARTAAPPPTATRAPAPQPASVSRAVPVAVVSAPPAATATNAPTPAPTATATPGAAAITTSLPPSSASAQVNYVVQYYSLNDSRDAPKDMQDVLLANGFHLAKRPEPGAAVIFQPEYFKNTNGYDAMKAAGMIGVVSDIDAETPTTYRVIVHTAFEAPPVEAVPTAPEDNFATVYDLPMGPYGKGQLAVFYFVR